MQTRVVARNCNTIMKARDRSKTPSMVFFSQQKPWAFDIGKAFSGTFDLLGSSSPQMSGGEPFSRGQGTSGLCTTPVVAIQPKNKTAANPTSIYGSWIVASGVHWIGSFYGVFFCGMFFFCLLQYKLGAPFKCAAILALWRS